MIDFRNKKVLVTGGSRGIGAEIVRLFARLNADVAYSFHRNAQAATALSKELADNTGSLFYHACELGNPESRSTFIDDVLQHFGAPDVLVNNAGIWEYGGPVDQMSDDTWQRTMDVNLTGVFDMTRRVVAEMKKHKISGHVVNIASTAGQRGEPFYSNYAASKGAVIAFTKSLGAELGANGIRVNCVAPGWVRTDMTREAFESREEEVRSVMATGKIPEAREIAGPVVFLASDWASAINGEILNVNAGSVMCG